MCAEYMTILRAICQTSSELGPVIFLEDMNGEFVLNTNSKSFRDIELTNLLKI